MSQGQALPAPFDSFAWSIGEEGSDPIVTSSGGDLRQDQFAQSGHYDHLEADLSSIADLGVTAVRYGTPWRLAEPAPGVYDWRLWDRALQACADAGLEPIVELVHFGLPDHYPGFVDTAWVDGFARYVDTFIARYAEPTLFTPINEPGVTAAMSARRGFWNDRLATPAAHATALANVVAANLRAMSQLRADRAAWWIGSEGFTVHGAGESATRRRSLEWLVWDLHFGHDLPDELTNYFPMGSDPMMDLIAENRCTTNVVAGLDIYPATISGSDTVSDTVSDTQSLIEGLVGAAVEEMRRWHGRYGVPFWIAETSNLSLPLTDQVVWLDTLAAGLGALRSEGLPACGLCWYSRGDQFDWQTALTNPVGAVTEVGLFDANRLKRPVADRFADLARNGPPASSDG